MYGNNASLMSFFGNPDQIVATSSGIAGVKSLRKGTADTDVDHPFKLSACGDATVFGTLMVVSRSSMCQFPTRIRVFRSVFRVFPGGISSRTLDVRPESGAPSVRKSRLTSKISTSRPNSRLTSVYPCGLLRTLAGTTPRHSTFALADRFAARRCADSGFPLHTFRLHQSI